MKREIKFRAWDGKEMHYPKLTIEYKNCIIYTLLRNGDEKDISVMQFTGLTDKNGKEIYEGDLVQNAAMKYIGEAWVVNFDNGYFRAKNMGLAAMVGIEVIGNIHKNPELI